ncbi:MAG: Gfo/Idh/MocA family oxidoreductase [Planctomycetaceae bacterium]|jgi:predicted dehydrogenase|nr:Gfo/Idh/MocA family oxidoreductase [Planctomycetaceae bacterium]
MTLTRRTFVKKSMAVLGMASTFTISGTQSSGQVLGANERLRIGVVGINGRGQSHIKEFGSMKDAEVTFLIDVDSKLHGPIAAKVERDYGNKPICVQDVRKALEDKNLDAISIATCNHTHALFTIWACQAGKDVYVEKPCSHNIFEGRKCVEATEKYKRIVQHGTQQRSSNQRFLNLAALKSGKYGTLKIAKGYCCKPRWSIGFKPEETPPETLNWDLWLGPAPLQPFHRNLVHYNWHWFWDTGCGDIGNQGVHEIDVCRWMTEQTLPKNVVAFGARYVNEPEKNFKDQGQTPNQQLCLYDYGNVKLLFETRGLVKPKTNWEPIVDVELYTDQGMIRGSEFFPYDSTKEKVKLEAVYEKPEGNVFTNFVQCVRNRERNQLRADILEAHLSAAHCHLGNISYRLGETASLNVIKSAFGDDPIVQKALGNVVKNTTDALPDLTNPEFILGQKLTFDPLKEKFIGNSTADTLLARDYRKPYVVPETV